MSFMCFFETPLNVPINRLVKWVVLTSPLKKNHEICFSNFLFFLIIHTKIQTFTLSSLTIMLESRQGSRASTCSIRRFLPSIFKTQFSRSRYLHYSEKKQMATLFPDNGDKCRSVKRVFFTSIYPTLIVNPGMICYLKECTQSEADICQSNASSIVLWIQE